MIGDVGGALEAQRTGTSWAPEKVPSVLSSVFTVTIEEIEQPVLPGGGSYSLSPTPITLESVFTCTSDTNYMGYFPPHQSTLGNLRHHLGILQFNSIQFWLPGFSADSTS